MQQIQVCKDCEFRQVGCHAICEIYISAKEEASRTKESIRKQKEEENIRRYRARYLRDKTSSPNKRYASKFGV